MRGLIIVNQELGHNRYKVKRLKEEFFKLNVSIDVFVNDGTRAVIRDNNLYIRLPHADFVIYLDKDIYLARQLEKAGYRLFNKADFIKMCDDKMLTNIACANLGIRMPKTVSAPLFYSERLKKENLSFLEQLMHELGMPMVVKEVYGSLGTGVHLVKTKEELIKLYRQICRKPIQFQEFISSSYGKSMRVLVIDKKVVGGFIRQNVGDFRSNFGSTATSKKAENCEKYFEFAQKIAEKFDIEYAGIDLLFGYGDEPILCEINSNAFFEEFERITEINVAKLIAEMIIKTINKEHEQKQAKNTTRK